MSDVRSEFEAWAVSVGLAYFKEGKVKYADRVDHNFGLLVWQAATKRVPMTDEQIEKIAMDCVNGMRSRNAFVRAIEAHHNIKGEQT